MSIATLTAPDIIDQHVSSPDTNQTAQHLMVVIEDVTDRRKAEEKIFHMAHHDPRPACANSLFPSTQEKYVVIFVFHSENA
jgi:hypothetical protein